MHNNSKWLLLLAPFLAVSGGIIGWSLSPNHSAEQADNSSAKTETVTPNLNGDLDQRLDLIVAQLSKLSSRVDRIDKPRLPPHVKASNDQLEKDHIRDVGARSENGSAELVSTFEDKLNESFQSEPVNRDWSSTMQIEIDSLFLNSATEVYQKTQLNGIECRSSSCKISVSHTKDLDPEDFEIEFFKTMAQLGMGRIKSYADEVNGVKQYNFFTSAPPPTKHSH